ncbi:hypothetical protein [Streptomyces sp. NPDC101249]|uniref:DUF7848 domain-containing protein n=1 Tax=Streptomyces sp. NPDC101249 TaxID=3366140 RepID=UPI00382CAEB4
MAVRARFRLRDYRITADPVTPPTYQAVCVTGEDADCGADSDHQETEATVERWIAKHTRDTGHDFYRRARWDFVKSEPGAWK